MRHTNYVVISLGVLLLASTVLSDEYDWNVRNIQYPVSAPFHPHFQFGFGADYRTDEYKILEHSPTFHARLYYFMARSVAFKTGLGYNQSTVYSCGAEVRTIVYDLGIRLQDQRKLISPYLETGLGVLFYTGKGWYAGLTETKPGVYLAVGAALRITQQTNLDFTFRHTINHRTSRDIILELYPRFIPPPPGHEHPTYRRRSFDESFYNPTTLEVLFRFKL